MTYVNTSLVIAKDDVVPLSSYPEEPVWSFELRAAASTTAIPTIRTVAADLAARADFDIDSIDDLRMAVDEACATLIRIAAADVILSCRFAVRTDRIELVATVEADDSTDLPPSGSFGWRILETLVDEVNARFLPGAAGRRGKARIYLGKDAVTARRP